MRDSAPPAPPAVTNARLFSIAGPAMLANLTTPLLGLVATAAIGRLGEAHLLGGVAMSALIFLIARGLLPAARYPALVKTTFGSG